MLSVSIKIEDCSWSNTENLCSICDLIVRIGIPNREPSVLQLVGNEEERMTASFMEDVILERHFFTVRKKLYENKVTMVSETIMYLKEVEAFLELEVAKMLNRSSDN